LGKVEDLIAEQDDLDSYTTKFRLWPTAWKTIEDLDDLEWKTIKFDEAELEGLPDVCGIYSFVINPTITNHPNRYLCYIGKTTRTIKERIREYIYESNNPKGRPKVVRFLNKWRDNLEVTYIEIEENNVHALEKRLNDAFLPPFQEKFSAEVNRKVNAF